MTADVLEVFGARFSTEHVRCDVCGRDEPAPVFTRMRHDVSLPTVICGWCGLVYTNPRLTPEANAEFYRSHYTRFHGKGRREVRDDAAVVVARRQAKQRLDVLLPFADATRPLEVLEVGSGLGQFLACVRDATVWRARGLEPGDDRRAFCAAQGLEVSGAFLEELEPRGDLDLVASFHVLEHMLSPVAAIQRIARLLKRDALLFLEVPNIMRPASPLADFLQLPHAYNFSAHSLRNVLARGGFAPLYWADRAGALLVVARNTGVELPIERCDVDAVRGRLKTHERLVMLSRLIPNVPVLRKVRASLQST